MKNEIKALLKPCKGKACLFISPIFLSFSILQAPVLLSSERMAELVNEVSERYSDRFIIVDSPPPRLTAETFVLATQVEGVLLVVKYGSTPRDMVAELIAKMGKDRILGCVVNHFDVRTPGYRYRYYGKYYGTYTIKKEKPRRKLISGKRLRKKK